MEKERKKENQLGRSEFDPQLQGVSLTSVHFIVRTFNVRSSFQNLSFPFQTSPAFAAAAGPSERMREGRAVFARLGDH